MKLVCPRCQERAYRVYIQVQDPRGETRSWVPQLGFVYCSRERGIVRVGDSSFLGVSPHRKANRRPQSMTKSGGY